jgi:hypothetical protein
MAAMGKEGILYLIDRDNMGHYLPAGNTQIVQSFSATHGSFSTPAFWQNALYISGAFSQTDDNLRMYSFDPTVGQFSTTVSSETEHSFPFPGTAAVVSASGTSNGIVWALDMSCYGKPSQCGDDPAPAVLYAFDATDLTRELWNSSQAANQRDQAGGAVKFMVPTVANGRVYIGTRTEVDVYGLLP